MIELNHTDIATLQDKVNHIDDWARLFKATTWEEIRMIIQPREYIALSASFDQKIRKAEVTDMTIAMANDHAGTQMKEEIKAYLVSQGYEVKDFGTYDEKSCDLSDFVYPAALAVARGECDRGIFCDGVGYGSALIANKINGCYAAVCQDPLCATLAREHTDSNILCLGAKIIGGLMAMEIVKTWLTTEPLMEEKYRRRVQKVCEINDKHCVPVK